MAASSLLPPPPDDVRAFLAELDELVAERLSLMEERAATARPTPGVTVADLLVVALRKELEAAEEAALWVPSERDVDVKLALMRQCGDEARHFRLVEDRLRELGRAVDREALRGEPSAMYRYLESLETTAERLAAGPFAREAVAKVQNESFIAFCVAAGDDTTAALYRGAIQPDESQHHAYGRRLLARHVGTAEARERARRAAEKTLDLAISLNEHLISAKGLVHAPGC